MTWVSILNQPESRVLVHNATTLDIEGTPVWVGPGTKPPYRLEVKGLYFGGLSQTDTSQGSALQMGAHAQVHQYPSESAPGPDKEEMASAIVGFFRASSGASLSPGCEFCLSVIFYCNVKIGNILQ